MFYVNENIKNLYRVKFHGTRQNVLRLDMNENPEGLPKDFVESVIKKITPALLATYPEKEHLIEMLAQSENIQETFLSLTNGSDEAMRLIFETFGCPGRNVVTVTPTFEMYDVFCKMFNMKHVEVSYNSDLNIDVEDILTSIDEETNIVVLLNPNSPIGTVFSDSEVMQIIENANRKGAIVVIDEAYCYFHVESQISLIKKYDNVLILRTFSKLFSLAGCRLGYVAGNSELISYIENAESTYNVNSIAILFAQEILKRPELIEKLQEIEEQGRKYLTEELTRAAYEYHALAGNYILIKPKKKVTLIYEELAKQKILVKYYSKGVLTNWIRVTTGSRDIMEQFWKAFICLETSEEHLDAEGGGNVL